MSEVRLSGPLFQPNAVQRVKAEAEAAIRELVEDGQKHLAEVLTPRPRGVFLTVSEAQKGHASTGNYRRNVTPVLSGMSGRIHDNNVVYGPWLEGVSTRNQVTRFKGYASFRKTADWLETRAKGVAEKHMAKAAAELNG